MEGDNEFRLVNSVWFFLNSNSGASSSELDKFVKFDQFGPHSPVHLRLGHVELDALLRLLD